MERALAALARSDGRARQDYVPVDVSTLRGRPGSSVVYVQQRHLGLPVYDGRRSVVQSRGRTLRITGEGIRVGPLRSLVPRATAEKAVRAAAARVLSSAPSAPLEVLARFRSPESFVAFRWKGLAAPITAHLVVFVPGRSHLAWVVGFGVPRGARYEVLLDADSLRLLKRRSVGYHLDACLHLNSASAAAQVALPLAPEWSAPASSRLSCTYESAAWTPPPPSGGLVCGPTVRDKRSLNVFCLASRGLDLLAAAGARMGTPTGAQMRAEILGGALADPAAAAVAFDDYFRLCGIGAGVAYRHAAYDPTVVLHEMSHIVLAMNLGGTSYPAPFESFGESGATAEGLADFLGLTLWNRIRREVAPPQAPTWIVGASFLPNPRDYSGWQNPPFPPSPGATSIQAQGMALCGALLFAFFQLIASGVTEQQAEDALWRALCLALQQMPHQGPLPLFCCVADGIDGAINAAYRPIVTAALVAAGLPSQCPH